MSENSQNSENGENSDNHHFDSAPHHKPSPNRPPGMISLFARHPNAHNLLMAIMILTGLFFLRQLNTQFFPTIDVPAIIVNVIWSGASAEDVESSIIEALEPGLRSVAGVDKTRSLAREGFGSITLEFAIGTDMQRALSDIESAVNEVTTLPKESEKPQITRLLFFENVMSLSLSGPFSEQALKAYAIKIRNDLLRLGIDRVSFQGVRPDEILIEVSEENLRRYDLTLDHISRRISDSSEDLPSGTLSGLVEKQIRSLGLEAGPKAMARMEVRSQKSGEKLLLRDIAIIRKAFDDKTPQGLIKDHPAIRIDIQRSASADILKTANKAFLYIARLKPTLPQSLQIEVFDIQSDRVRQRIDVLVKNGIGGLILVIAVLFLFLKWRVAFWVAMGIPTAIISAFLIMFVTDQSINMITLFGMIMMLGIVVDDAIVVGEHSATLHEKGATPLEATETGTARMLAPVTASSLTTIAAFMPMFLISDILGEFMKAMALVVITIIIMSLVEAFFVLPGHMRKALEASDRRGESQKSVIRFLKKIQNGFNRQFDLFTNGAFKHLVGFFYDIRYTTAAGIFGLFLISIGFVSGGHVGFQFFPSPEAETVHGQVTFLPGTPKTQVQKALKELEAAINRAEIALAGQKGSLIKTHFNQVGKVGNSQGDHLGQVTVELIPSELRSIRTAQFVAEWRKQIPDFAGLDRIIIVENRPGPPGRDIDIRLEGAPIHILKQAANELKKTLTAYGTNITNIEDDLPWGKREVLMEVTPRGYALGFTTQEVARQMRNAFDGAIAKRLPGENEEVTVRVRLPKDDSNRKTFSEIYLTSPSGQKVSLDDIVSIKQKAGFSQITRRDGLRTVSITADLNQQQIPLARLQAELNDKVMPSLIEKYNIGYSYRGRAEEQATTFGDLRLGFLLALMMIYFILAWVFGHYGRPIVVMIVIPFGFIGSVLGHFVMGYDLNMLAMVALLGLAGILINDSIVLVVQVQEYRDQNMDIRQAIVRGAQDRLRAVILTSATTVLGLLPLLFERSLQAQFLKPMAITMSWGVGVGTVIVLFVIPAFLGIYDDIAQTFKSRKTAPA